MPCLNLLATDQSITLYWDKPLQSKASQEYHIYLNDRKVATTSRTHFTADHLLSDTSYSFRVVAELDEEVLSLHAQGKTRAQLNRLDVTRPPYCACGDGSTLNTAALQRAFDDCTADDCVYFPSGVYMTGALRGHSNMVICLEAGAVLQGTDQIADYLPRIRSRFEGTEMECYSSLLNFGELDHTSGPNCENILIYGQGRIASGGQKLALRIIEDERERLKEYLAENAALVATCENNNTIPGRVRPRLINLSNCKNVRITGLELCNGASWNLHMIYCDGIVTDHCTFRSEGVWNGDGWDPDSSENCTLFASSFYTGDDAVAIKSGKNPEGNLIARPSRHIRVFDCYSAFGHGIVMGSEMSGGIEDVQIWDCDLRNSMSGLEIKATKKRGGYVRNVMVRDCVIPRIMIHSVSYNDDGIGSPLPPVLSDCLFERLTLTGVYQDSHDNCKMYACIPIEICGFDVPGYEVQRVAFKDITIAEKASSPSIRYAKDISFDGVTAIQDS